MNKCFTNDKLVEKADADNDKETQAAAANLASAPIVLRTKEKCTANLASAPFVLRTKKKCTEFRKPSRRPIGNTTADEVVSQMINSIFNNIMGDQKHGSAVRSQLRVDDLSINLSSLGITHTPHSITNRCLSFSASGATASRLHRSSSIHARRGGLRKPRAAHINRCNRDAVAKISASWPPRLLPPRRLSSDSNPAFFKWLDPDNVRSEKLLTSPSVRPRLMQLNQSEKIVDNFTSQVMTTSVQCSESSQEVSSESAKVMTFTKL